MSVDPFRFGSPVEDLVDRFFGGHDPFSMLGSRRESPPVQRVDLSKALSDEARDDEADHRDHQGSERQLPKTSVATVIVSVAVIAVVLGVRRVTRVVPGALTAVIGSIVVSRFAHLPEHGVRVLGPVPGGVPHLGLPTLDSGAAVALLGTSVSMAVVILAQSSATARAYAAKYEEGFSEDADLVGLGVANVAAAVSGTFVVNGSPTKTQMVDSAGGRSQLARLTTSAVVLLVLLFLTGPLAWLPLAVLATIVFLIGVELIDVPGMRHIFAVRREEFVVALLTAAAVVFVGVEQGIVLAIVASIVDHLRHSYAPRDVVLVPSGDRPGHWHPETASAGARSAPGLIVYRFGSSLYYANAHQLLADVTAFTHDGKPLDTFCLDFAAIGNVDMTAGAVLRQVHAQFAAHHVQLLFTEVPDPVRAQLDRYGITALVGAEAYLPAVADVLHPRSSLHAGSRESATGPGTTVTDRGFEDMPGGHKRDRMQGLIQLLLRTRGADMATTTKHPKRDDDTPDVTTEEPATGTLAEPVHTGQQSGTSTLRLPFVTASFTRTSGGSGVPNPLSIVAGVAGAAGDVLGAAVSVVPGKKVLFYTGVAALGVAGVVEWPVAAVVAAGTYVASRSGGHDEARNRSAHTEPSATASS